MDKVKYINGWFDITFLDELFKLNELHEQKNINGNILEIGTYQAKTFIPLSFLLKDNEQIIGVDLFSSTHDWDNGILLNSLNRAEKNLKKIYQEHIKNINYKFIKANSKNIKSNDYINYLNNNLKYRIIHIDANHGYNYVEHDLEQVKNIIMQDGYIICDDYGLSEFPDVEKATDNFLLQNKNFKINSQKANKLIIIRSF
jgi:hypothetical protein